MHGLLVALFLWGPIVDVSGQTDTKPPTIITEAPPAPVNVQPSAPPSRAESAQLRWLQEQLFVRDALYLDHRANVMVAGRTVDPADAYLIVGRPDLANRVRDRRRTKSLTRGVGVGAFTVGIVVGLVNGIATALDNSFSRPLSCGSMSLDPECADKSHASSIPWLVAIGGGVVWLTSATISEDPLGSAEKARLVADYNERLRAGLGLSF